MNASPEEYGLLILGILGFVFFGAVSQLIKFFLNRQEKKARTSGHTSS